jgi:uncharacterized protein (UPF0212 family)
MQRLSASDLLEVWERGANAGPLEQALVILAAAYPQASSDALASLTVAQRDAALFRLRELTFGTRLTGLAECPACHERLELTLEAADLRAMDLLPAEASLVDGGSPDQEMTIRAAGCRVRYRLPTSADLMKVDPLAEPAQARRALLESCVVSILGKDGKPAVLEELPPKTVQTVVSRIGKAAALADLTVAATCPACDHQWEIVFDIVSYFWSEISAWAVRMLHEVHLLAGAYGWREADILAMSAWRRQRYLELIGS